jgi:hypothetical protein
MENGILVEKKINMDKDSTQGTEQTSGSASKNSSPAGKRAAAAQRRWQPHNIAEYFFFNDNG